MMASPAVTWKAWVVLLLPERGRCQEKHGREKATVRRLRFKRVVTRLVRVAYQVARAGGLCVYRLPAWNPWQHEFLRGADALHTRSPRRHLPRSSAPFLDTGIGRSRFARATHQNNLRFADGEQTTERPPPDR